MTLLIQGATDRGEASFDDSSANAPGYVGVYVTEFNPILLDSSLRYNPQWRTFGQVSLCLEETVLSQWFVNFQYHVLKDGQQIPHPFLESMGFQNYFDVNVNNFVVPYVIKWQFRPGVVADIYYLT